MNADPGMCLSPAEIAAAVEGTSSPAERRRWEEHLASCFLCRDRFAAAAAPLGSDAAVSTDPEPIADAVLAVLRREWPVPFARRWVVSAAVAAALVAAAGATWLLLPHAGRPDGAAAFRLPAGRPIAGTTERIETAPGGEDVLSLPDGSRLRVGSASAVRFHPTTPGERLRVEIARGTVEAEIASAAGRVLFLSEAGEIHVRGTAFLAKVARIHWPPGGTELPTPILSVDVARGAVDLSGPGGTVRVAAGRRGILVGGRPPVLQEIAPVAWRTVARAAAPMSASPDFPSSFACVNLLAGNWAGLSDWADVWDDVGEDPGLRRLAATLVAVTAEPSLAGEPLVARFRREADEAIRLAVLPHAVRVASEPTAFLDKVAAEDPSETVRRAARRLAKAFGKE